MSERYPIRATLEFFGARVGMLPGKIRCPFHDDRTPSASWNEYHFKCWACQVSGDAVRLLVEQAGLSWREAFEKARELSGEAHDGAAGGADGGSRPVRAGFTGGSSLPGGSGNQRGKRPFRPPGVR